MKIEDAMPLIDAVMPKKPVAQEKQERKAPVEAPREQPGESLQDVKQASAYMQELAQGFNKKLSFSVDKRIDRILVKVLNKDTNEVVREIPSEDFVNLVARMRQYIGTMFDDLA